MFKTPGSRFALRATLVGIGAGLSSLAASALGSDLTSGECIAALASAWTFGLAYAGIGAASSSVEPSIGNKRS